MTLSSSNNKVFLGLVLGALAVRSPYDESVSLSLIRANLARVVTPDLSHNQAVAIVNALEGTGGVCFVGDWQSAEGCRVRLQGPIKAPVEFKEVVAGFVIGALALHYSPLVPVSTLRVSAYRLWSPTEVEKDLYPIVVELRRRGIIVSYDRTSDIDQWHVSLKADEQLPAFG